MKILKFGKNVFILKCGHDPHFSEQKTNAAEISPMRFHPHVQAIYLLQAWLLLFQCLTLYLNIV